jgi:hypothetical protein
MTPIIGVIASSLKSNTAYESIASIVPSSVSTYTFSSIPQTYKSLQLRWTTVPASANVGFYVRFNGVTANQYTWRELYGRGSALAINRTAFTGQNEIIVNNYNFGTIASLPASGIIDLLDYANTSKLKTVSAIMGMGDNSGSSGTGAIVMGSGVWNSTAAITSIEFFSGGTFSSGSLALYGIKG